MEQRISRFCYAGLILALAGAMLVGCTSSTPSTPAAAGKTTGSPYTSKVFTTSYEGALDASSQLMLGMLKLEGTDNAVTAKQADAMMRVMQSLQGQVLKSDAERNAVWAMIEAQLTPAQSSAIANMRLTQTDLQTWTQNNSQQGLGAGPQGMPGGAGPQGTPGAGQGQGGPRPQGTPGAGPAQGGSRPQGTPGARSGQGGPGQQGGGGAGAGMGQSNVLLGALIRLLTQRSGVAAPMPGGGAATPTPTNP